MSKRLHLKIHAACYCKVGATCTPWASARLYRFAKCNNSPRHSCISPQCPAVCPNSLVFSQPAVPLWFGKLFVMCSPAFASQPSESTQPRALINPAAVCVYCSAHSASRWVYTCWRHQKEQHKRCDCRAQGRGGSGRSGREHLSMCKAWCSTVGSDWSRYLVTECTSAQAVIVLQCVCTVAVKPVLDAGKRGFNPVIWLYSHQVKSFMDRELGESRLAVFVSIHILRSVFVLFASMKLWQVIGNEFLNVCCCFFGSAGRNGSVPMNILTEEELQELVWLGQLSTRWDDLDRCPPVWWGGIFWAWMLFWANKGQSPLAICEHRAIDGGLLCHAV